MRLAPGAGARARVLPREVERLTGRRVAPFMSDNHIEPDVGVGIFMLPRADEPDSSDYVAPDAPEVS